MLQKLRSRHPIDLPTEGFGHKKAILAVLGGIAVLFVFIPFLLSPLAALLGGLQAGGDGVSRVVVVIAAGFATLFFVLLVGALRGKRGHDRS